MLNLQHDIRPLRGAEYNPRYIDDDQLNALAESITLLGLVKPLIARGKVLVAGHQRTRALRKLGITHAAVYELPRDTTVYDEIRFNQLHNGTDMDSGDERCVISGLGEKSGFCVVPASAIAGNLRAKMAYVRREMSEMILKYGPWGGCVATQSGEVIHCAQYALASKSINAELTVYVIPDEKKTLYKKYLDQTYGVFSYSHLEKHTYVQTYAQMMRLRAGARKGNCSRLYEGLVIPWLSKQPDSVQLRGIDFGSGQGDYSRMLRSRGYNLIDVELFRRKGAGNALDMSSIRSMIGRMCESLITNGLFDYVICDSVLNSVDSPEAENAVLTFIKSLCKTGGIIFFSGRCLEFEVASLGYSQSASKKSKIIFLDENNFSAKYRKGHWFYQKFHSENDVEDIFRKYQFRKVKHLHNGSSFQAQAENTSHPDQAARASAIDYEFELPLPGGRRLGRSADVKKAFGME